MKTEVNDEVYEYKMPNWSTIDLDSSEIRQRRLEEELQHKLDEVYTLMDESTKYIDDKLEVDRIKSRLVPIKLHLNDKKFKVRQG